MKCFIVICFALLMINESSGQSTLAEWHFAGKRGDERRSTATSIKSGVDKAILSRGAGIIPQRATYSFASTFPTASTLDDAVAQEMYYEFSIQAKRGRHISLASLGVTLRAQKNAPKKYRWKYSVDGEHFLPIGESDIQIATTDNNGVPQPPVDLTGYEDLQNVSSDATITFRLYAWGGSGNENNAFRIGKSTNKTKALVIKGEVRE